MWGTFGAQPGYTARAHQPVGHMCDTIGALPGVATQLCVLVAVQDNHGKPTPRYSNANLFQLYFEQQQKMNATLPMSRDKA